MSKEPLQQHTIKQERLLEASLSGIKRRELAAKAVNIGQRLIDEPQDVSRYIREIEQRSFIAQTEGNSNEQAAIGDFTGMVSGYIDRFDWSSKQSAIISPEAARTLLLALPSIEDRIGKPKREPRWKQVATKIARGYLNTRFETQRDWRGALATVKEFFASTVETQGDLEALTKCFDLLMGKYFDVLPVHSLPLRAIFLGRVSSHPKDEAQLAAAYDVRAALQLTATLLHKESDLAQMKRDYDLEAIQLGVAKMVLRLHAEPEMQSGLNVHIDPNTPLDPTKGRGKDIYKRYLKHKTVVDDLRKQYGDLDFDHIATREIPADLLEVAQLGLENPTRDAQLESEVTESQTDTFLQTATVWGAFDARPEFPHSVIMVQPARIAEKLLSLFGSEQKQRALNELAQNCLKDKVGIWKTIPFAFSGIQGLALVETSRLTNVEDVDAFVHQLITQHGVKADWESFQSKLHPLIGGFVLPLSEEGVDFVVSTEAYAPRSQLEQLLDRKIPERYRNRFDILKNNLSFSQNILPKFRRMPTQGGDLYQLRDHPDMPNVVDAAILRKREGGGLEFELKLCSDPLIYSVGTPEIFGNIDFTDNRINIKLRPETSKIATDQRWIIDRILIALVSRSCFPPLREVIEEVQALEIAWDDGIKDRSVPGHITHVGGSKIDPKTGRVIAKAYTEQAVTNLIAVIGDLFGDTQDSNLLAAINADHRANDPSDTRFLTYNKGYKAVGVVVEPPRLRSSPSSFMEIDLSKAGEVK